MPIPSHVAGVVHIKDALEHLDDKQFQSFVDEVERVLVKGGNLIITELDYHLSTPYTRVRTKNGHMEDVVMHSGENYPEFLNRLHKEYGVEVKPRFVYYPRSGRRIIMELSSRGFKCNETLSWVPKNNEPEWFGDPMFRNVLVFSREDDDLSLG